MLTLIIFFASQTVLHHQISFTISFTIRRGGWRRSEAVEEVYDLQEPSPTCCDSGFAARRRRRSRRAGAGLRGPVPGDTFCNAQHGDYQFCIGVDSPPRVEGHLDPGASAREPLPERLYALRVS